MDPELLEASLALVDRPDDGLTRRFYDILFERHPDVRPMFGADIRPQAAMLRGAVVARARGGRPRRLSAGGDTTAGGSARARRSIPFSP